MKKLLYTVCIIGLLTFQSCDRINGLLGLEKGTRTEQPTNDKDSETESANSMSPDSTKVVNVESIRQKNDVEIKRLNDSLDVLCNEVLTLRSEIDNVKQKQNELDESKVELKNLFVVLALFFVVIIFLVIVLVNKITKKSKVSERYIKSIVEDFANKHQDAVSLDLSRMGNLIQQNSGAISDLNRSLNIIRVKLGQNNSENNGKGSVNVGDEGSKTSLKEGHVFYMMRTDKDKEFDVALKKNIPTEDTFYKFEINRKNPNKAHFWFDCNSENGVRWAVDTKTITLDNVCDVIVNGTSGKFNCTVPGEAELHDGKWIVKRKAFVIFD